MKWQGDYIISYLCPIKVPLRLLNSAKKMALNFHPGPPKYPGIGCTNYAIYNNDKTYGVTCHLMTEKIDDGPIFAVDRFNINKNETLYSLTQRSYKQMYKLYKNILEKIFRENNLNILSKEKWNGKAKSRSEFLKFLELNVNMSNIEIKKRILSTTYPGFEPAYLNLKGIKFFGKLDD